MYAKEIGTWPQLVRSWVMTGKLDVSDFQRGWSITTQANFARNLFFGATTFWIF